MNAITSKEFNPKKAAQAAARREYGADYATLVTIDEFGKWLSCTVEVEGVQVGIKAFGKWVQRMENNYKPYWSSDQCKTVSSFKSAVETGINYILQGA